MPDEIEPAEFDQEATPCVTLMGKQWPIAELVWRDLRRCRGELIELNRMINAALAESAPAPDESTAERGLRQTGVMAQVFDGLSNDDYERLVMAPIHAGLASAHPKLTRAAFDGWRMSDYERQIAWLTVRKQSGLFVFLDSEPGDSEPGDDSPGEADGAARSPS